MKLSLGLFTLQAYNYKPRASNVRSVNTAAVVTHTVLLGTVQRPLIFIRPMN